MRTTVTGGAGYVGALVVESEEKIRGGVAKRYRYDATRVVSEHRPGLDGGGHAVAAGQQRGRADWIALAREHRIPTLLDAAADVPPAERLTEYVRSGFDLVAFSGGKAMRGSRRSHPGRA